MTFDLSLIDVTAEPLRSCETTETGTSFSSVIESWADFYINKWTKLNNDRRKCPVLHTCKWQKQIYNLTFTELGTCQLIASNVTFYSDLRSNWVLFWSFWNMNVSLPSRGLKVVDFLRDWRAPYDSGHRQTSWHFLLGFTNSEFIVSSVTASGPGPDAAQRAQTHGTTAAFLLFLHVETENIVCLNRKTQLPDQFRLKVLFIYTECYNNWTYRFSHLFTSFQSLTGLS